MAFDLMVEPINFTRLADDCGADAALRLSRLAKIIGTCRHCYHDTPPLHYFRDARAGEAYSAFTQR